MKSGGFGIGLDFEIVLEGVGGIGVVGGNGGSEFTSISIHQGALEAFALVDVAVVEADGLRGFFQMQLDLKRLAMMEIG